MVGGQNHHTETMHHAETMGHQTETMVGGQDHHIETMIEGQDHAKTMVGGEDHHTETMVEGQDHHAKTWSEEGSPCRNNGRKAGSPYSLAIDEWLGSSSWVIGWVLWCSSLGNWLRATIFKF